MRKDTKNMKCSPRKQMYLSLKGGSIFSPGIKMSLTRVKALIRMTRLRSMQIKSLLFMKILHNKTYQNIEKSQNRFLLILFNQRVLLVLKVEYFLELILCLVQRYIITLNLILAASTYLLIQLVSVPQQQLDDTSKVRFFCLMGVNFILLVSSLLFLKVKKVYGRIFLFFGTCFLITIFMSICEIIVRNIQADPTYNFAKNDKNHSHLELTFLTCYFITYMLAIIGSFISAIYLLVTELLINQQQERINKNLNLCLIDSELKPEMENNECPICLQSMEGNQNFVEIKNCRHVFHRKCLVQWIVTHESCPLCRRNIFRIEDEAEESDAQGQEI